MTHEEMATELRRAGWRVQEPPERCPYCGGNESKCDFSFGSGECSQMKSDPPLNGRVDLKRSKRLRREQDKY